MTIVMTTWTEVKATATHLGPFGLGTQHDANCASRRWGSFFRKGVLSGLTFVTLLACGAQYHPGPPMFGSHERRAPRRVAQHTPPPTTAQGKADRREPIDVLEGQASYYHDSLAGNHTANGEIYDPKRLTAAHRQLPFGSVVRVVREDTGRAVIVRINDRGPFGRRKRIIDLSRAAAQKLDMIHRGVAQVRVEILELGPH